jgi:protein-S-isoprenylcysteine O-methyltransferase Ste14
MRGILTVTGIVAGLALATGMVASRFTGYRFWPPGERDWRWWTYIGLSGVATVSLLGVSYLSWNVSLLPRPEAFVAGGLLAIAGAVGFLAATFDLGVEESSGMEGKLRTEGFYRCTRNPQIVFLLCITSGIVVASASPSVVLVGAAVAVWFVSMPFAEEPWLHQQYGAEYREYCDRTPRSIR